MQQRRWFNIAKTMWFLIATQIFYQRVGFLTQWRLRQRFNELRRISRRKWCQASRLQQEHCNMSISTNRITYIFATLTKNWLTRHFSRREWWRESKEHQDNCITSILTNEAHFCLLRNGKMRLTKKTSTYCATAKGKNNWFSFFIFVLVQ